MQYGDAATIVRHLMMRQLTTDHLMSLFSEPEQENVMGNFKLRYCGIRNKPNYGEITKHMNAELQYENIIK